MIKSKDVKIIALLYAGGSYYSYRSLEQLIPNNFHWITLELPGRGTRMSECLSVDFDFIINDLFKQVTHEIHGVEYIIYGHSLGAILGYEIAKKMQNSKYHQPNLLFFTGSGSPEFDPKERISNCNKDFFWKKIINYGGIPNELINNAEVLDFLEPIIRADFGLRENYKFGVEKEVLNIPIFVRVGTREIEITDMKLMGWQKLTNVPINASKIEGNHFFIFDQPKLIIQELVHAYTCAKA